MSANSKIEWTDSTWNPITGCDRISPGCKHCYAKALHDRRHKAHLSGKPMPLQYHEPFEHVHCWPERLEIPLHWRAPRLCFVNSGADLFHEDVPFSFIGDIIYEMERTPRHTYQMLTKRAERMLDFFTRDHLWSRPWPIANLWPGVSVESKKYLFRLDLLRQVPAPVRMVSFEPLLEDLGTVNLQGIGWAILGFESGLKARPGHVAWMRYLIKQCDDAGVPVFVKQMGRFPVDWSDFVDRLDADKVWPKRTRRAGHTRFHYQVGDRQGTNLHLVDSKGGDPAEWPVEFRRREFPKPYPGHEVVRMKRAGT